MIVSYGQYMEYGVLANSVQVFLRFMSLSRRKAIRAAGTIGRTNLQASCTLWLLRNVKKKINRGTLVERSQSPAISVATDQYHPLAHARFTNDDLDRKFNVPEVDGDSVPLGPGQSSFASCQLAEKKYAGQTTLLGSFEPTATDCHR